MAVAQRVGDSAPVASELRGSGLQCSRRTAILVLAVLCLAFLGLGLHEAWSDAPTTDEGVAIAAGVTTLTEHDFRGSPDHPPLARAVAALPVLAVRPVIPVDESRWWRAAGDPRAESGSDDPDLAVLYATGFAGDFLDANREEGRLRRVVFAARLVPLVEGALVGLAAYALAAGLFGRVAGLLAAGLWLTNPYVLGMSHIDGLDVPFALATVAACLALRRAVLRPTPANLALVGLAAGVALLVRVTGIPLLAALAAAVALAAWRRPRVALTSALLVVVVAWATVWVGVRALDPGPRDMAAFDFPDEQPALTTVLRAVPWPAEYDFALAISGVHLEGPGPETSFLLGAVWAGPRWWFWPGSLLVKAPATTLLAMAGGVVATFVLWRRSRSLIPVLVVGLPALVLLATTLQVPRTVGLRYLLPVVALLAVLAGAVAQVLPRRTAGAVLAVVAVVQVASLVESWPHSLAWTSPPFRPGYRVATDSNLDWGQDLYRLESWLKGRTATVDYMGAMPVTPRRGVTQLSETPVEDVRGWVAVSANWLTGYRRQEYAWLRKYCTVGDLGGTILLYNFEEPPDPSPGPDTPAGRCRGGVSQ